MATGYGDYEPKKARTPRGMAKPDLKVACLSWIGSFFSLLCDGSGRARSVRLVLAQGLHLECLDPVLQADKPRCAQCTLLLSMLPASSVEAVGEVPSP